MRDNAGVAIADVFWLSNAQRAVVEPFVPKNRPGPEREDAGVDRAKPFHDMNVCNGWERSARFLAELRLEADIRRIAQIGRKPPDQFLVVSPEMQK